MIRLAVERGSVVADEHSRTEVAVTLHRVVDLPHDLGVVGQLAVVEVIHRLCISQRLTSFVDNAAVLLFQLEEHVAVRLWCGIAAESELFLVDGLIHRVADQEKIVGVEVKAAHGAFAVLVGLDVAFDQPEQRFSLLEGDDIFNLCSFKDGLNFHCRCLPLLL